MQRSLTGRPDLQFLAGLVAAGSHAPGMQLFSKRSLCVLNKPCALFLCTSVL